MTEVKAALKRARALIENGWCQGQSDSVGFPVGAHKQLHKRWQVRHVAPDNERQQCYCVTGALCAVTDSDESLRLDALDELWLELYEGEASREASFGLEEWNDHSDRTHAEVLSLFDAVLAA